MNFLKTTFLGGIVFLIPIAVVAWILGKVLQVMVKFSAPLADRLPIHVVAGVALVDLLAVMTIVLVCFLAGLLSKSRSALRLAGTVESGLIEFVPGYTLIKGLTGGLADKNQESHLAPVLARFDDSWQIAFRVEQLPDKRVVVFIPGAPDPRSGSVSIMEEERLQPLEQSMAATVRYLRAFGRGSSGLLSAGERDPLGQPKGQPL